MRKTDYRGRKRKHWCEGLRSQDKRPKALTGLADGAQPPTSPSVTQGRATVCHELCLTPNAEGL